MIIPENYLNSNHLSLEKIKSSIFKDKKRFSILVNFVYSYFSKIEKKKIPLKKIRNGVLRNLKNRSHFYFFISLDNKPVGVIHIFLGKKYTDLCLIYLEEKFRRKGIGSFVFNLLKDFIEKNNLANKPLCIEINKKNKVSQAFFSKMGAKLESLIYFYYF